MKLELKVQKNETVEMGVPGGGSLLLTPRINEGYWLFRVQLSDKQAVVGFPKFSTIGIGFQKEEDWNTNLPYSCEAEKIYEHIKHNQGDESVPAESVIEAIKLIQAAAAEYKKK